MTDHIVPVAVVNLTITDNADWTLRMPQFTDADGAAYDMSSDSFKMDVRDTPAAAAARLQLTTAGGDFDEAQADEGIIDVIIAKGDLAPGLYVYDLIRVSGGSDEYLCGGSLTVADGVTA